MPASVISAKGVVIKHGASASPTDVLAQVVSISVTPGERTLIPTTVHATTGVKAYINHPLRESLEIEITLDWDPTDTGHDAIYDAYAAGTLWYLIIVMPDSGAAEWSASGTFTKFVPPAMAADGDTPLQATLTFKALGAETYTQ
jgi:hypothetical protein